LSTLIKVASLKKHLPFPPHFNWTTWSLQPSHPARHFDYFCIYLPFLIVFVNSCNVCVFYFCISSTKLDLLEAAWTIILIPHIPSFCESIQGLKLIRLSALENVAKFEYGGATTFGQIATCRNWHFDEKKKEKPLVNLLGLGSVRHLLYLYIFVQWRSMFFELSYILEGATEKVYSCID
jgi:hypothetical protein